MGHYQELVVKPLEELASTGIGRLRSIGKDGMNDVYSFETGSKLFVTSGHHANEIYGTWQSVLQAFSEGVDMAAVPVVNAQGFDCMYGYVKDMRMLSGTPKNFNSMLYNFLINSGIYESSELVYPKWEKWNYGIGMDEKLPYIVEIEKMITCSSVVIDIHNHGILNGKYLIVIHETGSEIQRYVEEIIIRTIERNGGELDQLPVKNYEILRKGVYSARFDFPSPTHFASQLDIANAVVEVPSFVTDHTGYLARVEQKKIVETNLEILSRISEFLA